MTLRVLHVLNAASGGAAISTRELIVALRERGVESSAVCHTMGSREDQERLREVVEGRALFTPLYWWNRKIRAHWWHRPWLELKQQWQTGRARLSAQITADFAQQQRVDLIHTNTLTTPEGGMAAKRIHVPHVWHVRELVGPGTPFPLRLEGSRLGEYLRGHASFVVANSHITAAQIRRLLPQEMLRVIPNGLEVEKYASLPQRSDPRPLIVAMVANYSRWKKHDLFIEAAASVAADLPVEFRIYGKPPIDPTDWDTLIRRRGLERRVRHMGFIPDPVRIMSEIDVMLHPTDQESFGRVLVEAMAAGRPIIGVRGGGAAEIIVHEVTGLLVDADSATGLGEAVERLIRSPDLRRQLGEAGRRRATTDYDLRSCSEKIKQTYCDSLAALPAAPRS